MTTLFFLFTTVWIIYELTNAQLAPKVLYAKSILKKEGKLKEMLNSSNSEDFASAVMIWLWGVVGIIYFAWTLIGLMTSQWVWFIPLLLVGFIKKQTVTAIKIDGYLTAWYLTLMLIDTYHNII